MTLSDLFPIDQLDRSWLEKIAKEMLDQSNLWGFKGDPMQLWSEVVNPLNRKVQGLPIAVMVQVVCLGESRRESERLKTNEGERRTPVGGLFFNFLQRVDRYKLSGASLQTLLASAVIVAEMHDLIRRPR